MNVRTAPRMDKEAFFDWLATQERRFELVDGVPVMQPFTTRDHARICTNITIALSKELDTSRLDILPGDFAVETGPSSIRYADVMVCARPPGKARSTGEALALFEVLSSSTSRVDFGPKLREYGVLPGLAAYVVISQDEPRAHIWLRSPDGEWPAEPSLIDGLSATIGIASLGLSLPMRDVYAAIFD